MDPRGWGSFIGAKHLLHILVFHKILNIFQKIYNCDMVTGGHTWSHMVTYGPVHVPSYVRSQHWLYQSRNLHFHGFSMTMMIGHSLTCVAPPQVKRGGREAGLADGLTRPPYYYFIGYSCFFGGRGGGGGERHLPRLRNACTNHPFGWMRMRKWV